VVFSFFKKDGKDPRRNDAGGSSAGRPGARPLSKPVAKPAGKPMPDSAERANARAFPPAKFATTENAIPPRELARSLAIETAAKIDAIESEMARDFLRPAANTGNPVSGPTTGGPKPGAAAPAVAPPAPVRAKADVLDPGTDAFLGNINAIDVNTAGVGSVIDETAILYANGQDHAAESTLRGGIDGDTVGENRQTAWMMLFELVNQRDDPAGFEQLTMQYALRFENSPPAWTDYSAAAPATAAAAPVVSGPLVSLPAVIDAQIVKVLEHLKTLAAQHAALTLDVSAARRIDLVGAELLLRVVNAFKRSNHELTVLGAEQLVQPLWAAVEPGRRDASDAVWMLLLEVLRLLGRQSDFEEAGIQYCITFEVSPPSWEPSPPSLKARAAASVAAAPVVAAAPAMDPLDWRGVIDREGEPHFGRLVMEARNSNNLIVECRLLRRMAFSTATALLTVLMKLQAAGVRVEFRNVNSLVAALFYLLGITAIAGVQVRRT